jgi:hypothetical protein
VKKFLSAILFAVLALPSLASAAVSVSLDGVGTLTTTGTGERQGTEVRYASDFPGYRLIVDKQDGGQVRVTVCRAWSDLPPANLTAAEQRAITISGDVNYSGTHWWHAHTCPTKVFNRRVNLPLTFDQSVLPNYDRTRTVPEAILVKIASGLYPYQRFSGVFTSPYDPWTEEYGRVLRSFTGGALALAGTESSPLMPYQVYHELTGDPRAWEAVYSTADASGNYAIHYLSRTSKLPLSLAEIHTAPFLQTDPYVRLTTANGVTLPVPDVAHQPSLTFYAEILTGDRYYRDELRAWATYNLLTRPNNALRDQGILWSTEVRASAWGLRALGEAVAALPAAERGDLEQQLQNNLNYLNTTFVSPTGALHRDSGLAPSSSLKTSPWTQYYDPAVTGRSAAWNHYVLTVVLDWISDLGYSAAATARDHFLKVVAGVTANSQLYDWPWAELADKTAAGNTESWPTIMAQTFKTRTTTPSTFAAPLTEYYVAWLHAAMVLRPELGLQSLETAAKKQWSDFPPYEWALVKRTPKTSAPCQ